MAELATIVFTASNGTSLSVEAKTGGTGVFLPREGVDSFFPLPQYDEEWADSPDTEGSRRIRSRPTNPVGSGEVIVSGSDRASFESYQRQWEQLVEDMRIYGGELKYTPAEATQPITYLIESMRITSAKYDGLQRRAWVQPFGFEFTCLPYGLLPTVAATLRDSDLFGFDTVTNQDWSYDAGSGTLKVESGQLVPTSTAEKRILRQGLRFSDSSLSAKTVFGASVASGQVTVLSKRLDASNNLYGQLNVAGAASTLSIVKKDAGVESTLATSAAFALVAGSSGWLKQTTTGNLVTLAFYTANPESGGSPVKSLSFALAAGDATKFGSGVWGGVGLKLVPVGADYRWDEWFASGAAVRTFRPITGLEVPSVEGSVSALGDLVLTDTSSVSRRHSEAGLEPGSTYSSNNSNPVLIDSDVMSTAGFVGEQSTLALTGTPPYDPAGSKPLMITGRFFSGSRGAICATPLLQVTGLYRVKARLYLNSLGGLARVAWRVADGTFSRTDWQSFPFIGQWAEIDFGVIDVPPALGGGAQQIEVRVEGYNPSGGEQNLSIFVDYLQLLGASPWMKTRSELNVSSSLGVLLEDGFIQSEGSLTGKTSPQEKAYVNLTKEATTDFTVVTSTQTARRSATGDASTEGALAVVKGRAVGQDLNLKDTLAQVDVNWSASNSAAQSGLLVRVVDKSNLLMVTQNLNGIILTTRVQLFSAGVVAQEWVTTHTYRLGTTAQRRLRVVVMGETFFVFSTLRSLTEPSFIINGNHANLAGPLAQGDVYLFDGNTGATATVREYDNLTAYEVETVPPAIQSGRKLRYRGYDAIRQNSTGTAWTPAPAFEGGRLRVPAASGSNSVSRISFKADRYDVDNEPDEPLGSEIQAELNLTPRVLLL